MAIFNLGANNEAVILNVAEVDTLIVPSTASDYRANNFQTEDKIDISGLSETAQNLLATAQPLAGGVRLIGSFGQLTLIGITRSQLREENFISNRAPIAVDDVAQTTEGIAISIGVLDNDFDPNGDAFSVSGFASITGFGGTVSQDPNTGGLIYQPQFGFVGTDSFTYTIADSSGLTSTALVSVDVQQRPNSPPIAVDDVAIASSGFAVTIGVLENDFDLENDFLSIIDFSQLTSEGGSVVIDGTNLVYSPSFGFTGIDSFNYTITDGELTDTATVTVAVNQGPNQPPVAATDMAFTTENVPVSIAVLDNDFDPEGDRIFIIGISTAANGSVSISGNELQYNPAVDFFGTDSFNYTIADIRGGTATATVTVEVAEEPNQPPVAIDDFAETVQDTPIDIFVQDNDFDIDGDLLEIAGFAQITEFGGNVVIDNNGTPFNGSDDFLLYEPGSGFTGTDSFTYTITDGDLTDTATVSVTVEPIIVNRAPIAVDDTATTTEGSPATIAVLANDSDPDEDPLEIAGVSETVEGGTVSIDGQTVVYTPPDLSATITDSFTYTITDGDLTDTATVSVTVEPIIVNRAPIAVDDRATTSQGMSVEVFVAENDSDPDGDLFFILGFAQTTGNGGSVILDDNGTPDVLTDDFLLYSPDPNFTGTDSFTYTIADIFGATDTGAVTVEVLGGVVNQSPIAVDDRATTPQGMSVEVFVAENDSDPDGDLFFILGFAQTTGNGGSVILDDNGTPDVLTDDFLLYSPAPDFTGTDSFTYTIADIFGATDTGAVTVEVLEGVVNRAPIAVDDTATTTEGSPATIAVLANDSDPDEDPLEIAGVSETVEGGTVSIDGQTVVYTPPDVSATITDSFTYTITDGDLTDTATVSVAVEPIIVNDAPIAVDDTAEVNAGQAVTIAVLENDSDPNGDELSIVIDEFPIATANDGTVSLDNGGTPFDPTDDSLVYEAADGFSGTDSFTYTISDGELTDTATVNVQVIDVNQNPIALDDTAATPAGSPVTIAVLENDTDPDGDPVSLANFMRMTPSGGTIARDNKGTPTPTDDALVYTPADGFTGTDMFSYAIADGRGGTAFATVNVTVSDVNNDPIALDDTATTTTGNPVEIAVLENDFDPDGDRVRLASFGMMTPSGGTITRENNSTPNPTDDSLVYTPAEGFTGTDSFTYTINDGRGGTASATVTVTVGPDNIPPIALPDLAETVANMAVDIDVTANDFDLDGDLFDVTGVSETAAGGTVEIGDENLLTYAPASDFTGTDSFTYTIADERGATGTAQVTVTVLPAEDLVEAVDDTATTDEDVAVTIAVLANDSDSAGDPLSVTGVSQGANGSASISGEEVIYTPNSDFFGSDSFTYTISDGELTDTATVNVTVNPVNDAPIAVDDTALTTEGIIATIAVLANDTDPDGDTLSIAGVTAASNGSVSISGDEAIYTPNADFLGTDSFTYTISDGQLTDTATVTVTVQPPGNRAPIAVDDTALTTEGIIATIAVLANDTDPDGDTLSIAGVTAASNGSVSISGDEAIYTPNADFLGTDSFTYTISDGQLTDTATVTVTVQPPGNRAPIAMNDAAMATAGMPETIAVLANDTDPDGDDISIVDFLETTENGGTVTISNSGTPFDLTDDALVYEATSDFTGTDSFTYTISDGSLTSTATVTVTVDPAPNNAPQAIDDTAIATEGTPETIAVLANDFDPDGDPLEISGVSETTAGGTLSIDGERVVYTPAAIDVAVTDSFTYTISDGQLTDSATVTVNVRPANDPPVAVDDEIAATQGIPTSLMVLENDFDPNGDDISLVGLPTTTTEGGTVTLDRNGTFLDTTDDFLAYTSAAGFTGTDSFTYTIADEGGLTDTATVSITVEEGVPNIPPIAVDDAQTIIEGNTATIAVLANDSDPDGDLPLSIAGVTAASNGSVSISGDQAIYTPNTGFTGTDSFTYTMADARGATDTAAVTVTVAPEGNIAPTAVDDTATTAEDVAVTIAVLANDEDLNGDVLSVTGVAQGANGSASITTGGEVIYTPDADFFGTDSFTYTITDGEFTDSATVRVTVDLVNDAPIAVDDTAATTEGIPATIAVLANDSDPEDDPLEITGLSETAAGGTVSISGDTVIYTPAAIDVAVTDSFTYTISDGDLTDTATVTVSVEPELENLPPIAVDDTAATTEGIPATIAVLANDSDPENAPLTIEGVQTTTTEGGTVSISGETVVYTPPAVDTGETLTDSFTYTISDGELTDTATVTVSVEAEQDNLPPIAVDDATSTTEGIATTIAVLANDSDPEGEPLEILGVSGTSEGGTVSLDGETVIYTPPAVDGTLTDSFTYTISDGELTDTATVTVTVDPVNADPIAVDDAETTTQNIPVTIAVLDNDSDPDGDPLEITAVTDPTNGTATIDRNGTPDNTTDDRIVYTPDAGFNGTDNFTYSISDGQGGTDSATVTVTVQANDAPIAVDDARIIAADISINIPVLDNDSDPDGDPLTIDGFTEPTDGTAAIVDGAFSYTPDPGFTGDDSFIYTISDLAGETATAMVSINVQPAGQLMGTDGEDWIVGNNLLSTAPGGIRERLDGGDGDDTITGNKGADILFGGPGADQFVYLDLADSGADPDARNEGVDDIRDFNPAEDVIRLNFNVAPGTPVTLDDVQINLDFIASGVAIIALSGSNNGENLPENFAIRLSNLDPGTTPEQIEGALLFV